MLKTSHQHSDVFPQEPGGPADCVSCILLFIIPEANEISFETLSAISSFQTEPRHVVFLAGPEATETHHSLACVDRCHKRHKDRRLEAQGHH